MKKKLLELLAGLVFALSASVAQALIIKGDFNIGFPDGSAVTSLSGSFEADFDDSLLSGVGNEGFSDLSILTSFNLNPNPLGITNFDTTKVGMDLGFSDGVYSWAYLGGLPNVSGLAGWQDDFLVIYHGKQVHSGDYSVGTELGIVRGTSLAGTIETFPGRIPEPTTIALMCFGLAGIRYRRHRSG